MRDIVALAIKDLRLLARDKAAFFFAVGFPLVYAILFGMIFGGDGASEDQAISIAIVDEDHSPRSQEFVDLLVQAPELSVHELGRDEARQKVRQGKISAWIRLEKGFGSDERQIFSGQAPVLELGIDPSRPAEAGVLEGLLMRYGFENLMARFQDPEALAQSFSASKKSMSQDPKLSPERVRTLGSFFDSSLLFSKQIKALEKLSQDESPSGDTEPFAFQPFTIRRARASRQRTGIPHSAFDVSFPQSIAWAIMGSAAGFALSLAVERTRGTLIRLRAAPMSPIRILYGKGLACLLTNLSVISLLLLVGHFAFGVSCDRPALLVMAIASAAIGFVGLMALLAVIAKTEQAAGGIGWAFFLIMAMIGGAMMPLFLMPKWMQNAGVISPVHWTILSLEGAIWRDFSFEEMLLPCGVLLAIGAAGFALAARLFRVEVA